MANAVTLIVSSNVMIGRRIKISEKFIAQASVSRQHSLDYRLDWEIDRSRSILATPVTARGWQQDIPLD
jgi:hypothetical protein